MNINISPAAGCKIKVTTADNKVIETDAVRSIEFVPFFPTRTGHAEIFNGEAVLRDGFTVVDRFTLVVSGNTGKVSRRDRNRTGAVPRIEKQLDKQPDEQADKRPEIPVKAKTPLPAKKPLIVK